jgi:poly(3-hydroxyoctanoate) depolymerase
VAIPEDHTDASSDIRYVDVGRLATMRLRICVRGTGRPLLLITGFGVSLELAAPFERALHPYGVQTLAFDAPGMGKSTPYRLPHRMPGLARTIEQMLDALGYTQVDVLGVSFGGALAQQLARQAPRAGAPADPGRHRTRRARPGGCARVAARRAGHGQPAPLHPA